MRGRRTDFGAKIPPMSRYDRGRELQAAIPRLIASSDDLAGAQDIVVEMTQPDYLDFARIAAGEEHAKRGDRIMFWVDGHGEVEVRPWSGIRQGRMFIYRRSDEA